MSSEDQLVFKYVTLDWARGRGSSTELFAFKFLPKDSNNNVVLTTSNSDMEPHPILLMSNSCYAARPVGICMRSYDEFAQMASLLRPYINNMELPSVPYMKRRQKKESISEFLQWVGTYKEVLSLIAIQHFLYSNSDILEIAKEWKEMRKAPSGYPNTSAFKEFRMVNLKIPQSYEEELLREVNESNEEATYFNDLLSRRNRSANTCTTRL